VNEWLARLRRAFEGLEPRERLLVTAAGALLLAAGVWVAGVSPALEAGRRIEARAEAAERQLEALLRLRREYAEVDRRLAAVERKIRSGTPGNLRTTLENLARLSAVNVDSMDQQATAPNDRYRETRLAVRLEGVTLAQTINYLHKIETTPQLLTVKTLRMRLRADDPRLLDVNFTVSSFEPIGS